MKKYILDLSVVSVEHIHERYVLIKLTQALPLPEMVPGQFVEVPVRRPLKLCAPLGQWFYAR